MRCRKLPFLHFDASDRYAESWLRMELRRTGRERVNSEGRDIRDRLTNTCGHFAVDTNAELVDERVTPALRDEVKEIGGFTNVHEVPCCTDRL